jgi:amino acid transporter
MLGDSRLSERTESVRGETGDVGGSASTPARPSPAMALLDTTLFLVTAGCTLQWTATVAATGPSTNTTTAGTPTYFVCFSLTMIAICATLNVRGMSVAKWLNNAGAIARWLGTLLLVGASLYGIGNLRARRQSARIRSNAIG